MPDSGDGLVDDDANARLRALVAPAQHALTAPEDGYDFIAVGGGTAGLVATTGAASLGLRTALIERHLMGGDCLVTGCVPSKALLHAARLAHQARQAKAWGIDVGDVSVDFAKVMSSLRQTRAGVAEDDSVQAYRNKGVDVIAGEARFIDRNHVSVGGRTIRFKRALIGTGARPVLPDVPGLAGVNPLCSENLFELQTLPKRLAVIGGGPIGCEMAQAFARLGSAVTLVQRGPRLLPAESPEASEVIAATFAQEGITLRLNTTLSAVSIDEDERVVLTLRGQKEANESTGDSSENGSKNSALTCDRVLVATGRKPNVEGLGLKEAGVAFDAKGIEVNKRFGTTNPRIYAAGDVASAQQFTHAAWAQAEYAVLNALFPVRLNVAARVMPHATYTDPEVARVGLSQVEIAALGNRVDTLRVEVGDNDRARVEGESTGFAQVWLEKGSAKILAATVVSQHAGELIGELTLAMTAGLPLTKIADTIHAYPTRSELVRDLAYAYNFSRVTPTVKRWVKRWVAWLR